MVLISYLKIIPVITVIIVTGILTIIYRLYVASIIKEIETGDSDIELIDEVLYDNLAHVKLRRKVLNAIKSVGFYGFILVLTPLFLMAIVDKFQRNLTFVNEKSLLVVASGSMSYKNEANDYLIQHNLNNQFNTYDVIVVSEVTSEADINLYDIVAYVDDEGKTIIHRVYKIVLNDDGTNSYYTRGDSNNETDDFVLSIKDIKGKYTNTRIPFIGIFIIFFQSYMGIVTMILLVYCALMIDKQQTKINDAKNNRLKLFDAVDFLAEKEKRLYPEEVYYKNCVYKFMPNGFKDKEEITNGKYFNMPSNKLVKIVKKDNLDEIIELQLPEKSEGEETW